MNGDIIGISRNTDSKKEFYTKNKTSDENMLRITILLQKIIKYVNNNNMEAGIKEICHF